MVRRVLVYVFGLFILSLGINFAVNSDLGVSPMQSVPLVLSLITGITMGTAVFIGFSFYTLVQIPILGKEFRWYQLLQIPAAFVQGAFVDLSRLFVGGLRIPTYVGQLATLVIAIFFLASGIVIHMRANLISQPPDALVAAITKKIPNGKFHLVKIAVDSVLVVLAVALSLLFLGGIYGVREGAVIAAVLIGKCIPLARRVWLVPMEKVGLITWPEEVN